MWTGDITEGFVCHAEELRHISCEQPRGEILKYYSRKVIWSTLHLSNVLLVGMALKRDWRSEDKVESIIIAQKKTKHLWNKTVARGRERRSLGKEIVWWWEWKDEDWDNKDKRFGGYSYIPDVGKWFVFLIKWNGEYRKRNRLWVKV